MKRYTKLHVTAALTLFVGIAATISSCERDVPVLEVPVTDDLLSPIPAYLNIPEGFPDPLPFDDNPLTQEGVELGRKLFYDPILSGDKTQSCGSCHNQSMAFTDNGLRFSVGIDDIAGDRNAMPIINLAWQPTFFWDGRSPSLEIQALEPVPNPIEMHLEWPEAVARLTADEEYPLLFQKVFGVNEISRDLVAKAISQFERTLISGNSRYDQSERREIILTESERKGQVIFFTETGDCFHCHFNYPLMTDHDFHNNGLELTYADKGLANVTGAPADNGKFRTPTLRNIALTAPYMHDGRFETLKEVVDHYSSGLQLHPNLDPLFKNASDGGVQLSEAEKWDLIAFLETLTDEEFITNPAFADPNQPN